MTRIDPFLWFDGTAEAAADLYVSLVPDSRIDSVTRGADGKAFTVAFTLAGVRYLALNGGPHYKLTPAFSLFVHCADQAEVDRLWDALLADGGSAMRCGWLNDRFGLSWQIVPERMNALLADPDPEKVGRVMAAMMQMIKLDVAALERAYRGE
jgi:predicted 3-demethylubiquinone-9 3-methyltransferase (glyoxalase superfamily)